MTEQKDDYKDTLFLPTTEFPMRAGLTEKEPKILDQWWQQGNLYKTLIERTADLDQFILHWGPPFANGHLHMGHALTYVIKDTVIRSQFMLGKQAPSVTGWDCHGLPIEWKVEEEYRKNGKDKDADVLQFRKDCRAYAEKWKKTQAQEMKRLGIVADWDNPYVTMDHQSEADIASEALRFVEKRLVYRALRPVMWSVPERTALAEAEIEYKEHKSTTIYVGFNVVEPKHAALENAMIVIWTTTPWTIPANRMIAAHDDIEYGVYKVSAYEEEAKYKTAEGKTIVIAKALADSVKASFGVTEWTLVETLKGSDIVGSTCHHPLHNEDPYYNFDVPVLHGEFVTTDTGTGFVHCAPSHGKDDFILGQQNGIHPEDTVLDDGSYHQNVGLFGGKVIFDDNGKSGDANGAVISALFHAGHLLAKGSLRHEYPHSWRSGAPVIFRATPQWYIELDQSGLRQTAMSEIDKVEWFPEKSINRIKAMVDNRPDWCISRQRVWGVPIAIFYNKASGEILNDPEVHQRIRDIFSQEGADAWYGRDPQDFLGDAYTADDYEQVRDVIDVWFESGSTHAFVCEKRDDLSWPADLYLEGSDQHRGWFQSSLLQSCGTRGQAPYRQVATNGFVLDKDGRKMSKSLGNTVDPMKLVDQYGADIVRLWVLGQEYSSDIRISDEAIKLHVDSYRRFRNTIRYLLGALEGYSASERVDLVKDYDQLPTLEKWILHRINAVNEVVKEKVSRYSFHEAYQAIHDFCNMDLSSVYFDIRKDRLYCDRPDLFDRRATRTVMEVIYDYLTTWLAPYIPFTMEETWGYKPAQVLSDHSVSSVHYRTYNDTVAEWVNDGLIEQWKRIKDIRSVITGALEVERKEGRIRSSLEAHPVLYLGQDDVALTEKLDIDWADMAITSQCTIDTSAAPNGAFTIDTVKDVAVVVNGAKGQKCQRSWKILPTVGDDPDYPDLSPRDADAVRYYRQPNLV